MRRPSVCWIVCLTWLVSACGAAEPEVLDSPCAVLSEIHTSRGTNISGNASIGGLDDYGFAVKDDSSIDIIPPSSTPCANEIAQKLQAICPTCEVEGSTSCETLTRQIFETPSEACAVCGDDLCSPGEGVDVCPQDCRTTCGDGLCAFPEAPTCDGSVPECVACPDDCKTTACGDGICEAPEDATSCAQDCRTNSCGDGSCSNGERVGPGIPIDEFYCPADCTRCPDFFCSEFENVITCPQDCAVCGDNVCSPDLENDSICAVDCAQTVCVLDGTCDSAGGEDAQNCPADCDSCGNGYCSPYEDVGSCADDCTICGDKVCAGGELPETCTLDCYCGDGVCASSESTETCATDCP